MKGTRKEGSRRKIENRMTFDFSLKTDQKRKTRKGETRIGQNWEGGR